MVGEARAVGGDRIEPRDEAFRRAALLLAREPLRQGSFDRLGQGLAGEGSHLLREAIGLGIVEAQRGRIVISESLNGLLARSLREETQAAERSITPLTDRERDILGCLANGLSNKLIARELNIAEGTVKVHIKNLLKKLKFRSRLEAAVWAIDQNLRQQGTGHGARC